MSRPSATETTVPPHREPEVTHGGHRIYVRDYPGEGPPIVLMHGFPDNLRLHDYLIPHLCPPRRVVAFDFIGWGSSDKPRDYPHTANTQTAEVDAVMGQLELDRAVLVVHDASGPPGIDWSLEHPDRVAALVLLNTYYCEMKQMRRPEAIFLFSNPITRGFTRRLGEAFGGFVTRHFYRWQVGRFIRDRETRREMVPRLYEQFVAAVPAFADLNEDLMPTLRARTKRIPDLRRFSRPVRIVFGAKDPYLTPGVARQLDGLFSNSDLHVIEGARHYVQVDEPERVAGLILDTPDR